MTEGGRRPRRTCDEQIQALEKRALDLAVKTRTTKILKALKDNPSILRDVEDHVTKLLHRGGLIKDEVSDGPGLKMERSDDEDVSSSTKRIALARPVSTDASSSTAVGEGSEATRSLEGGTSTAGGEPPDVGDLQLQETPAINKDPSLWLPQCYTTLGAVSNKMLQQLLASVEPIAFSLLSLRGLCSPGRREVPKRAILELFEFVCGLDSDTILAGDMKFIPRLVQVCSGTTNPAAVY
jgi:hypothetical protein